MQYAQICEIQLKEFLWGESKSVNIYINKKNLQSIIGISTIKKYIIPFQVKQEGRNSKD